jgi:ketosteroid isomerase-like protein
VDEQTLRAALAQYSSGDLAAVSSLLADEIVWHVGGHHPYSGTYKGRDAVFGYFEKVRQATAGTMRLEPVDVLVGDRYAGLLLRARATRGEKQLDTLLAEAIAFDESGRWMEYWAMADDQQAVDAFWNGEE